MVVRDNGLVFAPPTVIFGGTPGRRAAVYANLRPVNTLTVDDPLAVSQDHPFVESTIVGGVGKVTPPIIERSNGLLGEQAAVGFETWWECFTIIPRDFDFGNILSNQSAPLEVYSAFRRTDHDWTAFVNNAGAGVTLLGLPTFDHTFVPQSDGGLTLTLEVSTNGQPVVDSTLDFVFGTIPKTINVPIELNRVVLFSIQPELPFTERLQWLTEVEPHVDGTELRISARKNPRQLFSWDFIWEDDGIERSFFHNILFDWQARTFGLPIWDELTRLTTPLAVNDSTLIVQSTDFADYRIGGLVLVFSNRNTFDVLELSSTTPTSLVCASGVLSTYAAGTLVMPLRTGFARRVIQGSRFVSGVARAKLEFRVGDNDVDLADTSAFSTYKSKVLIDGCNNVRGSTAEQSERDIVLMDNPIGLTAQSSPWDVSKRISQLALLAKGKQALWEVRGLLHALRGKQISFYSSTFCDDMVIDSDIAAGVILNVANAGYAQFVQARQPRDSIRIVYNDGSPDDLRDVVSAAVVDSTRETLTLDSALGVHTQATVERIMFVEKVRWDSDEITIRHERGTMTRVTGPVKTVLE
jgi:hypothetical protein